MVHHSKKQKVDEMKTDEEAVLFNSDTLSKIILYLPSIDVLSLALTCKRFGISGDDEQSLIKDSARVAVQDIATEEELGTLPYYNGENSLANYHYLQFMRGPLTFDQLVGNIKYVKQHYYITMSESEYRVKKENKSCVRHSDAPREWETAFSNNIMRAGKHYVTFETYRLSSLLFVGVMRPGRVNQEAHVIDNPLRPQFYQNFSRRVGHEEQNNNIQCCMYYTFSGKCGVCDWSGMPLSSSDWDGMESMRYGGTIGMLLDLDEGTLSVYNNGRKLGVMKRGLVGPYCWVASMWDEAQVTIKRGTIPQS